MNGIKKTLQFAVNVMARVARPVVNRIALNQASNISLARQRRALVLTADYVERYLANTKITDSKFDLLACALRQADVAGDRLICEFGVFRGDTINHLARLTPKPIFGFDSFEGLPEGWGHGLSKGHFALKKLPEVRSNVTLIKGWFDQTLPSFLEQHKGVIGFMHVDCDLYSSTKIIFSQLKSRLAPAAVIVFDEYFNYPGWEEGEYKAFQEFLADSGLEAEFIGYNCKGEQVAVRLKKKG
jgi:Methyltransferase domain